MSFNGNKSLQAGGGVVQNDVRKRLESVKETL
jgi:hypothetical protein